jgi:hypothetical protein
MVNWNYIQWKGELPEREGLANCKKLKLDFMRTFKSHCRKRCCLDERIPRDHEGSMAVIHGVSRGCKDQNNKFALWLLGHPKGVEW